MRLTNVQILAPLACAAIVAGAASAQAAPSTPSAAVEELLDADRQFSADAAGDNIVDGIAAMLAPEAKMPTPQGVFAEGRQAIIDALRANPLNANATAEWAPVRGGISANGLQGFTYGFMIIHIPDQPDRRAKYLSYWVKQPEGWRVVGYKRAGSPPGAVSTSVRAPALPPRMIPERPSSQLVSQYRSGLADRERAFSERAHDVGLRQAFLEFGSADAMNMGPSSDFVYGNVAISQTLPPDVPSPVIWAPDKGVTVSSTGDLGVTFGFIRPTNSLATIPFFTVWRRDRTSEPWLYVAE